MEKMDRATEARILSSIEKAIRLTKEGMDSSKALLKVASEDRMHPEIVKRMAEAMNVSRTRAHMRSTSVEKRAESFPLVDAHWVLDQMYPPTVEIPSQQKAAGWIHPEYDRPETQNFFTARGPAVAPMEKAAEAATAPRFSEYRFSKLMDKQAGLKKLERIAKSDMRIAESQLFKQAQVIAAQFRDTYKFNFPEVERRVFAKYGEAGRKVMDMLHGLGGLAKFRVKRADLGQPETLVWNGQKEPYGWIDDLFLNANKLQLLAKTAVDREYELAEFNATHGFRQAWDPERAPGILDDILEPPVFSFDKQSGAELDKMLGSLETRRQGVTSAVSPAPPKKVLQAVPPAEYAKRIQGKPMLPANAAKAQEVIKGAETRPFAKRAFDPGSAGMVMGSMALGLREPPEMSKYREVLADVYDPIHEGRMESVNSRAMLNDFLSNDPILSSYEPEAVTGIYNQIASMAPNAARQPVLMRGLLRKAIQQGGIVEPFEVQQLTQMEEAFKGKASPTASPLYAEGGGK